MRKNRRRITRRKRKSNKKKVKNWIVKHYNSSVTNRYTKITTDLIIFIELFWLMITITWFLWDISGR